MLIMSWVTLLMILITLLMILVALPMILEPQHPAYGDLHNDDDGEAAQDSADAAHDYSGNARD